HPGSARVRCIASRTGGRMNVPMPEEQSGVPVDTSNPYAPSMDAPTGVEEQRLTQTWEQGAAWHRWGPYVSARQWGTVREDYSPHGGAWEHFPHDHARSRAYRWGEDGIFGISDDQSLLCFALALWNEHDPILKERFFGVSGPEGNHGEDVK